MVLKAIIPAAGYGTRNLPATKAVPKELFPISGRPAIDYIVSEAMNAGIQEILIILSRNKTEIMNYFDRSIELERHLSKQHKEQLIEKIGPAKVYIQYARQPDALGLGHAVQLGKKFAGDHPFAVMLPDQVCLAQPSPLQALVQLYEHYKSPVIGLQKVETTLLKNYGIVAGKRIQSQIYNLQSIVEKPKINPPSRLAVMGRYILTPEIFPLLEQLKADGKGEIQLTDALNEMCRSSKVHGYVFKEKWYDISIEREYINIQRRAYLLNKS
ncbi:UTP--glucose-1-phosphate uridylyltransferase [Paenibacillus alkaliterrae]|uniref:UTP--glucose-1-phosphate uridylyltransferase n=1 Tax=Paenibacillus alkaliterrae TaxID=320909 RepID=UPI001F400CEC|nr:UTP--glucose-1-phosphate uridylyltransferase [Paenibacillus alkaliterrae]MCF2939559.1 UTP--glucose-1-phosphate uridylyltransferase [Paenibacillus alkaliterrae]